jgi:sugar phosphate isomerase/epimerase
MAADATLRSRLGPALPHEWWPTPSSLKETEASGFGWVQLPSPPPAILANPRTCVAHARGAGDALAETGLRCVLHGPPGVRAGDTGSDRALEGAVAYAAECGADAIVVHARDFPEGRGAEDRALAETRSLAALAGVAERVGIALALENLAPVYPGPEQIAANPLAIRSLVRRISSPAVGICLDVGHANVIAGLRRTSLSRMIEPVLDLTILFHLHDNLGARWQPDHRPEIEPLRLDLHLAPGRGTLPFDEIAASLRAHHAPLLLEVHPPRSSPAELLDEALIALGATPEPAAAI